MNSIGIDPGVDGGLALIRDEGQPIVMVMPTIKITVGTKTRRTVDVPTLVNTLRAWERQDISGNLTITLEKTWGMNPKPKAGKARSQGAASMFTSGDNYGQIKATLTVLAILCEGFPGFALVAPQTWMKTVMPGYSKDGKQKPSVIWARQMFPMLDLRASERCKVPHDGITDALGIAYYGKLRGEPF